MYYIIANMIHISIIFHINYNISLACVGSRESLTTEPSESIRLLYLGLSILLFFDCPLSK